MLSNYSTTVQEKQNLLVIPTSTNIFTGTWNQCGILLERIIIVGRIQVDLHHI